MTVPRGEEETDSTAARSGCVQRNVAHTATNRLLLCGLLGIDPRRYRDRLEQGFACLNILEYATATEAKGVTINDTSHLDGM